MKIKTLNEFKKLEVGDLINIDGDVCIIVSVGYHDDRAFVKIADFEPGDGIETDDTPIEGTEYILLFSEAKNHVEPMVDLSFRKENPAFAEKE